MSFSMNHIEQYPYDNLKALSTPSKSGYTFSKPIVWKYLRSEGFFRFKALKMPYLSLKYKKDRLN